jgi:hypothetical protein
MDLVLKLSRPDGVNATQGVHLRVEFSKARGIYGPAGAPFVVQLTPDGWVLGDDSDRPLHKIKGRIRALLEQLALLGPEEQPKSMGAVIDRVTGKKADRITAFSEMCASRHVVKIDGRYRLADGFSVPNGSPNTQERGNSRTVPLFPDLSQEQEPIPVSGKGRPSKRFTGQLTYPVSMRTADAYDDSTELVH